MRRAFATAIFCLLLSTGSAAVARDLDGRYAGSPLKPWFDRLASKKGLCCSVADGLRIADVDWDTQCERVGGRQQAEECRFRVRLKGEWTIVPEDAVVGEPNKFGPAVVWPMTDDVTPDGFLRGADGQIEIRCFLPGAGA